MHTRNNPLQLLLTRDNSFARGKRKKDQLVQDFYSKSQTAPHSPPHDLNANDEVEDRRS